MKLEVPVRRRTLLHGLMVRINTDDLAGDRAASRLISSRRYFKSAIETSSLAGSSFSGLVAPAWKQQPA
jgi:hypothetical protein